MITNETIIKAANAAGLDVREDFGVVRETSAMSSGELLEYCRIFNPLASDFDNAMIRRGAEIDAMWISRFAIAATYIEIDGRVKQLQVNQEFKNDKAQAEREAVILCAAAKFDAMNKGEQK